MLLGVGWLLTSCAHSSRLGSTATDQRDEDSTPAAGDVSDSIPPPGSSPVQEPITEPNSGPSEIVFAAVGDVMLGTAFPEPGNLPPGDGAALLREVTPLLQSADVAFGNLEGPLVDDGRSTKCKTGSQGRCYAFRVPTRYGRWLREAGFSVLSLANNHAGDFGAAGRRSTRDTLDALGIAHSGELDDVAWLTVKGRRLALIAFATSDATHDLRDIEGARRLVSGLAARADLVLVSMHGGAEGATRQHVPVGAEEFLGENRGDLRAFAHAMIDAGAALVVGSGPHVVRGMEVYRDRLVAYSLGNFATYGSFNLSGPNGLSLVLEVRLGPNGAFRTGRIHPLRQDRPGGPRFDPSGEVIRVVRQLSIDDFGPSAVRVEEDGSLRPPQSDPAAEPIG